MGRNQAVPGREGLRFTAPFGEPPTPNTPWTALTAEAGLRDVMLHGARHAATVLLILEVPVVAAVAIMGWSSAAMPGRCRHLADSIRREIAMEVLTAAPGRGLVRLTGQPMRSGHRSGVRCWRPGSTRTPRRSGG
jgi:hypothetical protein